MVKSHGTVFIYQRRPQDPTHLPRADDFTQADDARAVYPVPVVLCRWFGDALGLFAKANAAPPPSAGSDTAAAIEAVSPDKVDCAAPEGSPK